MDAAMEGVMVVFRYVRKYVNGLLKTSLQAREFFLITRYDGFINALKAHLLRGEFLAAGANTRKEK